MGQGRQAKRLSPQQAATALSHFATTRHPLRDHAMCLLATKAGFSAPFPGFLGHFSGIVWIKSRARDAI